MVAFISPFGPSFLASFLLLLFPFFVGYMFCYCMFFAGCSKCLKEFTRDQFNKQNYGGYREVVIFSPPHVRLFNLQACQSWWCCRLNSLEFFWIKLCSAWLNWGMFEVKLEANTWKCLHPLLSTVVDFLNHICSKNGKNCSGWRCWPRNQAIALHKQYARKIHKTTFSP